MREAAAPASAVHARTRDGAEARRHGVGDLLREWRARRRLSQEALSQLAGVSTRHLSYVENGHSQASRALLSRLAAALDLPLRERHLLLLAGGYAAERPEVHVTQSPETMRLLETVMEGAGHFPVIVLDRWWDVVARNEAAGVFLEGVDPVLVSGTVNVASLLFAPGGTGDRVENAGRLRARMLERLEGQVAATGDARLRRMARECRAAMEQAANAGGDARDRDHGAPGFAETFTLVTPQARLSFVSTVASLGAPLEVAVSELVIETFYPADESTRDFLASR